MTPYVLFSASLHAAVVCFILFFLPSKPDRKYYVIDLMGGQSGLGPGLMQPAPAPAGGKAPPSAAAGPSGLPPAPEDPKRISVDKTPDVPAKADGKKAAALPKAPRNKGMKGGRGESADGKGDVQGTKSGPVGGAGTSLEIGGFGPGGSVQTGPRFPYQWYVQTIYKRLWENWERTAAEDKSCGVAFTIQSDGAVKDVVVEETSGDAFFDLTARRAVSDAAPFPPLPSGYEEPTLRVVVKFRLQ